jgi:hypothetical protein
VRSGTCRRFGPSDLQSWTGPLYSPIPLYTSTLCNEFCMFLLHPKWKL